MTEVWIHLGTEKTGSSALQSHCAVGREELRGAGVWFARGARFDERCMQQGLISGGNALVLAQQLEAADWTGARNWLARSLKEARAADCPRILVSSELLLAPLAGAGRLNSFRNLLEDVGVVHTHWLLILRHPEEQFISLYRHRAKRGTAGPIDDWAKTGYQLPDHLRSLREQWSGDSTDLMVRRYARNPDELQALFFVDWLGVSVPGGYVYKEVNPSLSLSELVLIRQLATWRPGLVSDLYERLLRVPRGDKVNGKAIEAFSRAVAAREVSVYEDEWDRWNALLPEGEKLEVPGHAPNLPASPGKIELSEAQVDALMKLIADSNRLSFQARLVWRNKLRPFLGQVKRMTMAPLRPWAPKQ